MSEPVRIRSNYFLVNAATDDSPSYPLTCGTYGEGFVGDTSIPLSDKPYPRSFPVRPAKWPVAGGSPDKPADEDQGGAH